MKRRDKREIKSLKIKKNAKLKKRRANGIEGYIYTFLGKKHVMLIDSDYLPIRHCKFKKTTTV